MHWLLVASLFAASSGSTAGQPSSPRDPSSTTPADRPSWSRAPAPDRDEARPGDRHRDQGSTPSARPEVAGQKQADETKSTGAQTPEEKKKLEEEIAKELGASPQPGAQPGQQAAGPTTAQPQPGQAQAGRGQAGGNPFARILFLPDISAIGRAAVAWNQLQVDSLSPRSDPFAPAHKVQPVLEEVEVALQSVVDPYARADVFLSFNENGAEVEEAYLTTLTLPFALQARGGQFFAPFGRMNQQHPHVYDFVDRPLALARLLGVDALKGPGVDVAWLVPAPWFAELRVSYQSLTPDFLGQSRNAGIGRLLQFFDVSDSATLGLGASGAIFDEPGAGASRHLVGGDAFLKIRPLQTRSYLALQSEIVARWLTTSPDNTENGVEPSGTEWGGYLQAVWRDGPYFAYGARYERAPAVDGGPENRVSALATWLPSEFERIRLQVSYDRLPGGRDGFEALLHLEFVIGAHGAHPF